MEDFNEHRLDWLTPVDFDFDYFLSTLDNDIIVEPEVIDLTDTQSEVPTELYPSSEMTSFSGITEMENFTGNVVIPRVYDEKSGMSFQTEPDYFNN